MCDPPSSKRCCLIYKIRGLPLTLMIHFVNVQTSKLEQLMQYVWVLDGLKINIALWLEYALL